MRWIPCSERLPYNDDHVLCTVQTIAGVRNVVRGYFAPELNRWVCGMNSNVIAWMPMPDPYEPEERK